MSTRADEQHDVLIVGAGPVGLAAALLADRWGLRALVVERRVERSKHPKARGIRFRATELLRQWGLLDTLAEKAAPAEAMRFIYCDSLVSAEIGRTPPSDLDDSISPVRPCRVSQDVLEDVLDVHVRALPNVTVRYGVSLTDFVADGHSVRATLESGRDSSFASASVSASYLIAADGVTSGVRQRLGLELAQQQHYAFWQSILWRGDIAALTEDRPCIAFFIPAPGGFIGIGHAGEDRWVTTRVSRPGDDRQEVPTVQEAQALVRDAVGVADLAVEVLSIASFRISADVAESFQVGRVFLAGDAAHVLPPTGGFGINTGLADAHNLLWKLAFVHRGWAGLELLDTYSAERMPVAASNAGWSVENAQRLSGLRAAITDGDDERIAGLLQEQGRHVFPIDQDLGFRYAHGAISAEVSGVGGRAPHAELFLNGSQISTLDLFDDRLVLLAAAPSWLDRAAVIGAELGVPIRTILIGAGSGTNSAQPVDDNFAERYRLTADGAILVRPDGHVGWRTDEAGEDAGSRLRAAVRAILKR